MKAAVLPVPVWAPPMMSLAGHDQRNGLLLDRRRFGVTLFGNSAGEFRAQGRARQNASAAPLNEFVINGIGAGLYTTWSITAWLAWQSRKDRTGVRISWITLPSAVLAQGFRLCIGTMTFGVRTARRKATPSSTAPSPPASTSSIPPKWPPVPPSAESYGKTEQIVGTWLKRQPRDKVDPRHQGDRAGALAFLDPRRPERLRCEEPDGRAGGSLQRLQTDYVDLYQLHWPARNQPMFGQCSTSRRGARRHRLRETLEVLAGFVRAGKVRMSAFRTSIRGASCASRSWRRRTGCRASSRRRTPTTCSTGPRNRSGRSLSPRAGRPAGLFALGFGFLSGKYLTIPTASGRVTQFSGFAQRYSKPNVDPAVRAYAALAREQDSRRHSWRWPGATVAGAWRGTIIGATTMAQLEKSRAWDLQLSERIWRPWMRSTCAIRIPHPEKHQGALRRPVFVFAGTVRWLLRRFSDFLTSRRFFAFRLLAPGRGLFTAFRRHLDLGGAAAAPAVPGRQLRLDLLDLVGAHVGIHLPPAGEDGGLLQPVVDRVAILDGASEWRQAPPTALPSASWRAVLAAGSSPSTWRWIWSQAVRLKTRGRASRSRSYVGSQLAKAAIPVWARRESGRGHRAYPRRYSRLPG